MTSNDVSAMARDALRPITDAWASARRAEPKLPTFETLPREMQVAVGLVYSAGLQAATNKAPPRGSQEVSASSAVYSIASCCLVVP